jgi:hypothetical protein
MSAQPIFASEFITVEYIPEKGVIHHTIHKPVSGAPFRSALDAGSDAMRDHNANKWLSDDRLNGPISQEDFEWSERDWARRTVSHGWKYWAVVVPQEIVAAGSLMPVIEHFYSVGVRMQVFSSLEAAYEWLDRMP